METLVVKQLVEELKKEWQTLWRERIDDKLRAEGIADKNYERLFVERGTIIFATRKFRMLSFREILQLHGVVDVERVVGPHPSVGGWGKFIRTVIAPQTFCKSRKRAQFYADEKKQKQHLKKGGRGWLHIE